MYKVFKMEFVCRNLKIHKNLQSVFVLYFKYLKYCHVFYVVPRWSLSGYLWQNSIFTRHFGIYRFNDWFIASKYFTFSAFIYKRHKHKYHKSGNIFKYECNIFSFRCATKLYSYKPIRFCKRTCQKNSYVTEH